MQDFRKLVVWKEGHELTLSIYHITASFPREETYGLTSQLRRARSSIPTNIAEGCGRTGNPELARFLHIAMGSACEVEYLLILARDLGYLDLNLHESLEGRLIEIKRKLSALQTRIKERQASTKQK